MQQYQEGQRLQGSDGNVYVVQGGVPVLDQPTATLVPQTIGTPDPAAAYAGAAAAANLARTQQSTATDAARLPGQMAADAAQLRAANLAAAKAQRELAAPTELQTSRADRTRALDVLASQLDRTQELYAAGPGATGGFSGIKDYLPSDANARFDTAGAALSQQGLAAFRVPGTGTVSDRDAAMFDRANLPQASNRDAANEEIIGGLQRRIDEERRALGLQPRDWFGGTAAATGPTRTARDPGKSAALDAAIRSGKEDAAAINARLGTQVTDEQINRARSFLKTPAGRAFKGSLGEATYEVPNSFRERVSGSSTGAFLGNAFNDFAGGIPAAAVGNREALEAQQMAFPSASLAGSLVGGVAGAAATQGGLGAIGGRLGAGLASRILSNPLTADTVYGGVAGATSSDDPFVGGGVGALAGLAGGTAGRQVARAGGMAFRGVRDADVRYLSDRGVPLTVGQALGGVAKGLEDRLTGLPLVGNIINNRRREGFEAFNRAALNEAVAPIRGAVTRVREQGVEEAQDLVRNAYDSALSGVRLRADLPYVTRTRGTLNAADALPGEMAGNARYTLNERVGASFDPVGRMDGNGFQQSIRGLRRDASAVANQPYGYDFGQVTRRAEGDLEDLLTRQSPGTLPAYNAANSAYRNVGVVRDAVNRGRTGTRVGEPGLFAPSQLSDAAAANARKFGNSQGTTNQPFFDLTRAGQRVLPSSVPDSGTAGRLTTLALPGILAGGGAGVGAAGGDTSTGATGGLALGALLAAGGSRGAQRAATRALLNRPDALIRIGDGLYNRALLGGMFGAGLASSGTALALQP